MSSKFHREDDVESVVDDAEMQDAAEVEFEEAPVKRSPINASKKMSRTKAKAKKVVGSRKRKAKAKKKEDKKKAKKAGKKKGVVARAKRAAKKNRR